MQYCAHNCFLYRATLFYMLTTAFVLCNLTRRPALLHTRDSLFLLNLSCPREPVSPSTSLVKHDKRLPTEPSLITRSKGMPQYSKHHVHTTSFFFRNLSCILYRRQFLFIFRMTSASYVSLGLLYALPIL